MIDLSYVIDSVCLSDINECLEPNKGGCGDNAVCLNTVGSRTCKCKDGFSGDGMKCEGNGHHAVSTN